MSRTRSSIIFLLLAAALPTTAQTKREKRVGPKSDDTGGVCDTMAWKLVWNDEFDGTALDGSKWITWFPYSEDGSDRGEGCRIMGTSNTIFRDDLVKVEGGNLRLGVRAQSGEWYGKQKEHEGSMVHSIGDARFTQGRFEVRCRIPRGAGLWPAFWGFGGETEIDVFEFCGEQPRLLKGALHRWSEPRFSSSGKHKATDLSYDFHLYAVEWEADGISWYLDGALVQYRGRFVDKKGRPLPKCDRPRGANHTAPYFPRSEDGINIILDLAVSEPKGFCKGPRKPRPWPEGASFDVDYVRVYQRGR
ncbi:MAG: glycoside hydrolase family 16 protein [Flavobacteriales bacterium]|nr:glycoside hydrolase family 16 protein [Flavobacteriales bacterium]